MIYFYMTSKSNDLQHHGIMGQKWGVRRFQNKDGSYTSEGKKRKKHLGINEKGNIRIIEEESSSEEKKKEIFNKSRNNYCYRVIGYWSFYCFKQNRNN